MVVAPIWPSALDRVEGRRPGPATIRAAISARVYLPAVAIVGLAALLISAGWVSGWGSASFTGSLGALRLVVVGPLSVGILAVILVVERLRPAQRRPLIARGHRQDVLYAVLNATVVLPLITALTLSFVAVVRAVAPWLVLPTMPLIPKGVVIALIFVAMDGCNWFVHLANHRVRALWRFHELHHSQEDMNALTVFRTHPFIHVSYLLALVPGTVLLANGAVSTSLLVAYGGIVAFAHSNTNLGFGPLRRIIVSPNFHRIHHRLNGAQDVNLGFALTIWDQLFGRAVFPTAATIAMDTGIPGRPLAVEQAGDRPRHLAVFAAQLAGPFRPMREPVDLPSIREAPSPPWT